MTKVNYTALRKLLRMLIKNAERNGDVVIAVVRQNGRLCQDDYRYIEIKSMSARGDCAGGICLRGRRLDSEAETLSTYSIEWFCHFDTISRAFKAREVQVRNKDL